MARSSPLRVVDAFPMTGQRWHKRVAPRRLLSDVIAKQWMEGAVPVGLAILLSVVITITTPELLGSGDRSIILRSFAELGFVAVGLTIVLIAGGFDLSVGSQTGFAAIASLVMFRVYQWPVGVVVAATLACGIVLGSVNGLLIAKLKTRPFITTLVTSLTFRAFVTVIQSRYSQGLVFPRRDPAWSFLGQGSVGPFQTSLVIFVPLLVATHLFLSRSRWGWWATAVGSDRRSARRNGIPVDRVVLLTYVQSGVLCAVAGLILSARQASTSAQVASGLEISALTAVVLGGVSLRGGRGSVIRAAAGAAVVGLITQAIFRRHLDSSMETLVLASVLLAFAVLDQKWGKYRDSIADKLSVSPFKFRPGPLEDVTDPTSRWRVNHALSDAEPIGLGVIEGAEDCVLDDLGRLYCGDRRGWIWRFSGDDLEHGEVFARTGGTPLGHVWDVDGTLLVAVSGMGVCRIDDAGEVSWIATQTRRTKLKVHDDAALRFADDLDVAPDGSVYFTEASTRVDTSNYHTELVEYRPNGRVLRYDPSDGSVETVVKNYHLANGLATAHDGASILIASTGLFRVDRLWISGPRQGRLDPVLENLPGYPDNINRASDGNYWLSFVAMRTPLSDLMLEHRSFRRRMTKELPVDDWIVPQYNVSCVVKFTEEGEILKVLWDGTLEKHPMVTSMTEHRGHLYLAGLENNRIGKLALPSEDLGPIDPYAIPGRGPIRHRAVDTAGAS